MTWDVNPFLFGTGVTLHEGTVLVRYSTGHTQLTKIGLCKNLRRQLARAPRDGEPGFAFPDFFMPTFWLSTESSAEGEHH